MFDTKNKLQPYQRSKSQTILLLVIFLPSIIIFGQLYITQNPAHLQSLNLETPPFRFSNSCACQSMFTIGNCEEEDQGSEQLIPDWKSIKQKLKLLHEGEYIAGHEVYSSLSRNLKSGYKIDNLSEIPTFRTDAIHAQLPYVSCKQHFYSPKETLKCVKMFNQQTGRLLKLAFVGDSTVRLFMETFVRDFDAVFKFHFSNNLTNLNIYEDFLDNRFKFHIPIEGQGLMLQFYWAPYLEKVSNKSFYFDQGAKDVIERWVTNTSEVDFPDIVLISYGMWNAFYKHPLVAFDKHYSSLVKMTNLLSDLASKTNVFLKLTSPIKQWLLRGYNSNVMNVLDFINHMAFWKLSNTHVWIWDSLDPAIWKDIKECEYYVTLKKLFNINTPKEWACTQIVHFGIRPAQVGNNMLLNFICNKLMNFEKGSCCA